MGFHDSITDAQAELIQRAPLFFVASAHPEMTGNPGAEGPVNVSPKGGSPLHIINRNQVAYLDYPGSGNETARHAQANGPVTAMVMSFEANDAAIVRLYGLLEILEPGQSELADQIAGVPAEHLAKKPRQVFLIHVERTQTSCGYGVPVMEMVGERSKEQRGRRYRD